MNCGHIKNIECFDIKKEIYPHKTYTQISNICSECDKLPSNFIVHTRINDAYCRQILKSKGITETPEMMQLQKQLLILKRNIKIKEINEVIS